MDLDPDLRSLPVDGELALDASTLTIAGSDFGQIVRHRPQAVLLPASTADIATVLRFATDRNIPVAARGRGHSGYGQAQVRDGIVVDLAGLAQVRYTGGEQVVADAGATWAEVLRATLPHQLTPPVLPDYLGLSVGGALSVGGLGGTSHRYGAQTDNVFALDAVTGDGEHRSCSPDSSPDLFNALRAGFGRCGVITQATLRLVPAPARVRRYKFSYPSVRTLLERQRQFLHEGRFDHLQGQIFYGDDGVRYLLDAAIYYTPPEQPDDKTIVDSLGPEAERDAIEDVTYWEFADRLSESEAHLRETGEWHHPHPWCNLLLPDSATDGFLDRILPEVTPETLGAPGLVLVYPIRTANLTTPLFRVPDGEVVFLVAVLRFAPPHPAERARELVETNRRWYEAARDVGGTAYPVGAIPFTEHDWQQHYGRAETALTAARERFDPGRILGSGLSDVSE